MSGKIDLVSLYEVVLRVVVCIFLFLVVKLFWVNLKVDGCRYGRLYGRIRTEP